MDTTISCFVAKNGQVIVSKEIDNVMKTECLEYGFDLEFRRFHLIYCPKFCIIEPMHRTAVRNHFDQLVGTPEKLMELARVAHFSKEGLARLLVSEIRPSFFSACAVLEKEATSRCGSSDPCLEEGCAFEGNDEVCLNAVLLSEGKCLKACTDVWVNNFKNPENRIEIWKS